MNNTPIDIVTVGSNYKDEIHLIEAVNATPTTANLRHYIEVVKENSKRINAYNKALEVITALETEELSECRGLAEKILENLDRNKSSEILTFKEAMSDFFNSKGKSRDYILTGFEKVDTPIEYIVLGGRP